MKTIDIVRDRRDREEVYEFGGACARALERAWPLGKGERVPALGEREAAQERVPARKSARPLRLGLKDGNIQRQRKAREPVKGR